MFPEIAIEFLKPFAAVLLAASLPLFFFLSWKSYQNTLPPLQKSTRFFLTILRFISFVLIVIILFQPVFQFRFEKKQLPLLHLLWDNSSSMQIVDTEQERASVARELFDSDTLSQLSQNYRILNYSFDVNLDTIEIETSAELSFESSGTNISKSLRTLQQKSIENPPDAVMLFSDGRNTEGSRNHDFAKYLRFPVHSIVIGENQEKPDIILDEIISPSVAYVDQEFQLEAVVRAPNLDKNQSARIELHSDQKLKAAKRIKLPEGSREFRIKFTLLPERPGVVKYSIHIPALEGEITKENNTREVFVEVLERKLTVTLLAGAPHPDVGFLRRLLSNDQDISLNTLVLKSDGTFYDGNRFSDSLFNTTDVFILHDFPGNRTPEAVWNSMQALDDKPCLLFSGKQFNRQQFIRLNKVLPAHILNKRQNAVEILPVLTPAGHEHAVFSSSETSENFAELIEELPSLFSYWEAPNLEESMTVLLSDRLKPGNPLALAANQSTNKWIVVLGTGLYRWDLLMTGLDKGNEAVSQFMFTAIRWLAVRERNKSVQVKTNNRVYRAGEPVHIIVEVLDGLKQAVDQAGIDGRLLYDGISEPIQFTPRGGGKYESVLRKFQEGGYEIQVAANKQNRTLGRDTTEFSISRFNPEYLNTKSDPEFLAHLASATGAYSGPPDSLPAILGKIDLPEKIEESRYEYEPLHSARMLIVLLALLCLEWLIRKRRGLV